MNINWKNILGSPRFYALIIALAFIVAKAAWPAIPLDETEVIGAVGALVVFIASVSVQQGPTVWAELFGSGKFWALLTSLTFIFIRAFWAACPFTEEQILAIIVTASGVSLGTSYRPINTTR
jgi:hypothetical protein